MFRKFRLALLLLAPQLAFAWGELGHRVVGEIAQRHLCVPAAQGTAALLSGESLAEASTWADDIRSRPEYRYINPWHFVSMPLNTEYADAAKSPHGDVVTALQEQLALLNSPLYPHRAQALRLVIHFVGDAHQPFHAGAHDDGGGNGLALNWFGWPTNLHAVWDSRMLRKLNLSFTELANFLDSPAKPAVGLLTPEDWVNESSRLASQAYPHETELGYAYHDRHIPTVKERLREAGLRLAALLNTAFGCPAR